MHREVDKQLSSTFSSNHKCLKPIKIISDLAEDLEQTKGNTILNSQVMENLPPVKKCPECWELKEMQKMIKSEKNPKSIGWTWNKANKSSRAAEEPQNILGAEAHRTPLELSL